MQQKKTWIWMGKNMNAARVSKYPGKRNNMRDMLGWQLVLRGPLHYVKHLKKEVQVPKLPVVVFGTETENDARRWGTVTEMGSVLWKNGPLWQIINNKENGKAVRETRYGGRNKEYSKGSFQCKDQVEDLRGNCPGGQGHWTVSEWLT